MEADRKKDLNEKLLDGEKIPVEPSSYSGDEEEGKKSWCGRCCSKLDNKTVLFIVCCLFACFATSEVIAAVAANSLSLLGDGAASCVDVVTYCSNLYAESIATPKAPPVFVVEEGPNGDGYTEVKGDSDSAVARNPAQDARVRMVHEVYVPGFSVVTLVIVTIIIMSLAIVEIDSGGDDDTNETVMFAVASVNVVIDITCITMFYYRKEDILHNKFPSFAGEPGPPPVQQAGTMFSNANINMFAAFTHIGSDTLRTLAIYLAAITAASSNQKSSLCDAWAAIVVSITIYFAMIPLSMEVYHRYKSIRSSAR